jgi:aminoglycoside phosphotransferase (APT) family kinase protein
VKEIAGRPGTLIHGEFYPSNVLVQERWGERHIRPVDWEMAGVGPPLLDLAALTSGEWDTRARTAMALAYRDAALQAGALMEPMDRFLRTLTACRLLLAVQWLGWGRGWEPPPHHRQNWLAEASRCAEELEEA